MVEDQQEGRVGERRGPDRRGGGDRRIRKGRRIWNRRINEVAVEDDQRETVRRMGSVRRGGAERRRRRLGGEGSGEVLAST